MTYRLPSLNALRAFEASARHLSFKHAAAELCVTASAVSQQVKSLETAMGITLFQRLPRGLTLTEEGEAYLAPISDAFKAISRATDDMSLTLKARDFRLGLAENLNPEVVEFFQGLKDRKTGGPVAIISSKSAADDLMEGRVDALVRTPLRAFPGLHLDQLEIPAKSEDLHSVTLLLRPGTVGCREHVLFLEAIGTS